METFENAAIELGNLFDCGNDKIVVEDNACTWTLDCLIDACDADYDEQKYFADTDGIYKIIDEEGHSERVIQVCVVDGVELVDGFINALNKDIARELGLIY